MTSNLPKHIFRTLDGSPFVVGFPVQVKASRFVHRRRDRGAAVIGTTIHVSVDDARAFDVRGLQRGQP